MWYLSVCVYTSVLACGGQRGMLGILLYHLLLTPWSQSGSYHAPVGDPAVSALLQLWWSQVRMPDLPPLF